MIFLSADEIMYYKFILKVEQEKFKEFDKEDELFDFYSNYGGGRKLKFKVEIYRRG